MERGYHQQYTLDQKAAPERVRTETADPNLISSTYLSLFHCLGATAEDIAFSLAADAREELDSYQKWYSVLKTEFIIKATKAATAKVNEKWLNWKADQLNRLSYAQQSKMAAKIRERGIHYFIELANILGL